MSRRWFAFRLRTLLIVIAVLSVPLGWVKFSLEWIRQRQWAVYWVVYKHNKSATAPGGLWLFGEIGLDHIDCSSFYTPASTDEIKRLFAEATVTGTARQNPYLMYGDPKVHQVGTQQR